MHTAEHPTRWTREAREAYARDLLALVDEYAAAPADVAAVRLTYALHTGTRYEDRPAVRAHFLAMLGALVADAVGTDDLQGACALFGAARAALRVERDRADDRLAVALNRACYPMLDDEAAPAAQRPTIAALRAVGELIARPVVVDELGAPMFAGAR